VGLTSVGSGSLMIVLLLFLYPLIGANQLVGTDLTQAVPLTAAAALGWILCLVALGGMATWLIIARPWQGSDSKSAATGTESTELGFQAGGAGGLLVGEDAAAAADGLEQADRHHVGEHG
jgi:hypothetical protein